MSTKKKPLPTHFHEGGRGLTNYLCSTIKYWPLTHIASGQEATKLIIKKKPPPHMCEGGQASHCICLVIVVVCHPHCCCHSLPLLSLSPHCCPVIVISPVVPLKRLLAPAPPCEQWLAMVGAGVGSSPYEQLLVEGQLVLAGVVGCVVPVMPMGGGGVTWLVAPEPPCEQVLTGVGGGCWCLPSLISITPWHGTHL